MWSVSDLGFLLIDGERAANEDGEELGEIKCVSEGKVNGELVMEFKGNKARRILQTIQYSEKMSPEGIVDNILSIIDEIPIEKSAKKQRVRKRKFLESDDVSISRDSIKRSVERQMDDSISHKMKGTMTKDIDQLTAFHPDFCPRLQKNAWVQRLKEVMRVDNGMSLGIIPIIKKEETLICLGGNHKVKALQEIQSSNPEQKIQVTVRMYEGLTMEECWRLSNKENDEKAGVKQLTFQDKVFQARRLKDQPKMREKLSLIFDQDTKKLKADAMGTISSVARYGESCWALAEDLFVKFEDRYGVGKSMSQSLFRNLQGVNDEIKLEVLNEALENGIERGAKMAGDLKARHKLRDFFMHRAGVQSWSEVEEKYPESAIGVEKFVVPKISRRTMVPEDFVLFTEKCVTKELPKVEIDIKVTVDGEESGHFKEIISSFEKKIKDEIEMTLMTKSKKSTENEQ